MKRFAGFSIICLIVLITSPAWAQQKYISGNIGFGIRSDSKYTGGSGQFDNDPAFVVNGAVGMEVKQNIRVEGEIGYHRNGADRTTTSQDFNFSMISFMANGYFDIPTQSPIKPYVGGGLGVGLAGASEDTLDTSDSDLVGALQLMVGVGYDISPKATLTFGYRYFMTTDPDFFLNVQSGPDFFETEFDSHDFLFGARFKF